MKNYKISERESGNKKLSFGSFERHKKLVGHKTKQARCCLRSKSKRSVWDVLGKHYYNTKSSRNVIVSINNCLGGETMSRKLK